MNQLFLWYKFLLEHQNPAEHLSLGGREKGRLFGKFHKMVTGVHCSVVLPVYWSYLSSRSSNTLMTHLKPAQIQHSYSMSQHFTQVTACCLSLELNNPAFYDYTCTLNKLQTEFAQCSPFFFAPHVTFHIRYRTLQYSFTNPHSLQHTCELYCALMWCKPAGARVCGLGFKTGRHTLLS